MSPARQLLTEQSPCFFAATPQISVGGSRHERHQYATIGALTLHDGLVPQYAGSLFQHAAQWKYDVHTEHHTAEHLILSRSVRDVILGHVLLLG